MNEKVRRTWRLVAQDHCAAALDALSDCDTSVDACQRAIDALVVVAQMLESLALAHRLLGLKAQASALDLSKKLSPSPDEAPHAPNPTAP